MEKEFLTNSDILRFVITDTKKVKTIIFEEKLSEEVEAKEDVKSDGKPAPIEIKKPSPEKSFRANIIEFCIIVTQSSFIPSGFLS